jgi:hypothetical protein
VFEIDERTVFPEFLLKLISGDDLTGLPDESHQDLQRLSLKPQTNLVLAQLARCLIEGERTKNELPRGPRGRLAAH